MNFILLFLCNTIEDLVLTGLNVDVASVRACHLTREMFQTLKKKFIRECLTSVKFTFVKNDADIHMIKYIYITSQK